MEHVQRTQQIADELEQDERLSRYQALTLAVQIARNEILHDAMMWQHDTDKP